ncbi:hypothetical protein GCM10008090_01480 [Arenicella chitinivorans]|uniref:Uncharacterized protein n=1 Tax=Arenicella chitinivorans TaxID=1329800 RepID=A0A918RJ79_9GAMM|nr:hypothetical protein [Arenicella chitinivorans]GGZ96941.1 hypothetical protein GCM10008090_01480 [Arenicella chitinivorans]
MRGLKTISYFSEDADMTRKRAGIRAELSAKALSDENLRSMRSFLRHIEAGNWERAVKYLRRLSKSSLFLTAIARGGFVIRDSAQLNRREIINRVIQQINARNKIRWLRTLTYHGYVNQVSSALFTEFRCDSLAAFFIIKNNRLRIHRGWVQGWTPEQTARKMQR